MKKTLKIGYKNKDFYIKESENCSEELKQDFLKYLKERKKSLINCAYDLNSVVFEINNHSKRIKNRVLKHKNKQIVCYYDYFRDHCEYDFIVQYPDRPSSILGREILYNIEDLIEKHNLKKESFYFRAKLKNYIINLNAGTLNIEDLYEKNITEIDIINTISHLFEYSGFTEFDSLLEENKLIKKVNHTLPYFELMTNIFRDKSYWNDEKKEKKEKFLKSMIKELNLNEDKLEDAFYFVLGQFKKDITEYGNINKNKLNNYIEYLNIPVFRDIVNKNKDFVCKSKNKQVEEELKKYINLSNF